MFEEFSTTFAPVSLARIQYHNFPLVSKNAVKHSILFEK
jgi:hypothetical protein